MQSDITDSTQHAKYQICELHSQDQNYHTAVQNHAPTLKNKLNREDRDWIIIHLAFNSRGTQTHLPL